MIQNLLFSGQIPSARFGHTLTLLSQDIAILYGGAVGSTGSFDITGQAYHCDINHNIWTKLVQYGQLPGIRAAHGACAIQGQLIMYGGALKSGQFADSQIYIGQLKKPKERINWSIKRTVGPTPGKRYGHCLAYMKPYIIVFGGNTSGSESISDSWIIDISEGTSWICLDVGQRKPKPRAYHSCAVCQTGKAKGMMVVFGGRLGQPNKNAPLKDTWGLRMHRQKNWDWVLAPYVTTGIVPTSRYQHTTHFIHSLMVIIGGRQNQIQQSHMFDIYDTQTSQWHQYRCKDSDLLKRFRHSSFISQNYLYIHGGFIQSDQTYPTDSFVRINLFQAFKTVPGIDKYFQNRINSAVKPKTPQQIYPKRPFTTSNIRLCPQVYEYYVQNDQKKIQKKSLFELQEQSRRLVHKIQAPVSLSSKYQEILQYLLQSNAQYSNIVSSIKKQKLYSILQDAHNLIQKQSIIPKLKSPAKIFGDVFGKFNDLINFFTQYGFPSDKPSYGDIQSFDYIFLGNYVDYGDKSLEVIILLLVLKLIYPDQIHLLRGWHQDKKVNFKQGLYDQCSQQLSDKDPQDPTSIFFRINKVFNVLPLAAIIDDKILCVHRGIGNNYKKISQLEKIVRPTEIAFKPKSPIQQLVYYTVTGQPKQKSQSQSDYDLKRIIDFMNENSLNYIIRGGDIVEGFDCFHKSVISICSSTNVRGMKDNQAAILLIKKNCQIAVKYLKQERAQQKIGRKR